MKVWIVLHGEQHEGCWVVSVHSTKAKAVKAALAVKCRFAGGWRDSYAVEGPYWENGCDFVKVSGVKVK
jgi:hypothetical protein